jgi:transposase
MALRSHYPGRDNDLACRTAVPEQVTPTQNYAGATNSRATNFLPAIIELSVVQREILDLIIKDQTGIQGSVQPERAILLWSDGISESATAKEVGISEGDVRIIRGRWLASAARIAAAEKKLHKTFNGLVSLIFKIPNEECSSESTLDSPTNDAGTKTANRGISTGTSQLHPGTRLIIEILHHKPSVYGINRSNWTQESIAEAFGKLVDWTPSKTTVYRLLKQAGLSWKKSRRVLTSPDPKYREKVELLLRTLQSLKKDEDLFFIDELGPLQVRRYGGRCYTPRRQTPSHPQNQRSKGSITIYGALSATTNEVTWFYGNTKDSAGMFDLAEILFNQYHHKSKIYLTWDAASWHGSDDLVESIDSLNMWNSTGDYGPIIEFVPLPSSAQFLNVIEAVFSAMKRAVVHNSDYQSVEEMKTAISTHFRERNEFFKHNPKRAGKKIWDIDFFHDPNHIRSGNYREW